MMHLERILGSLATLADIALLAFLGVGGVLVVYGTVRKTDWGINLKPLRCPRCETKRPLVRVPQSLRQAMWGGGFCAACGAHFDKWGREIEAQ
jgi:hypothetical protein